VERKEKEKAVDAFIRSIEGSAIFRLNLGGERERLTAPSLSVKGKRKKKKRPHFPVSPMGRTSINERKKCGLAPRGEGRGEPHVFPNEEERGIGKNEMSRPEKERRITALAAPRKKRKRTTTTLHWEGGLIGKRSTTPEDLWKKSRLSKGLRGENAFYFQLFRGKKEGEKAADGRSFLSAMK